jgi:uncharacterized protein (DUF2141 family)
MKQKTISILITKIAAAMILLVLAIPILSLNQSPKYSLTIEVHGIRKVGGLMNIGLFSDSKTFPERNMAHAGVLVKVANNVASHTFRDLPPGNYAVAVFHDRNSNGSLDKNLLGIPSEGFGFSNDALGTFGPPSFNEAAITLKENKSIRINLRHY